VEWGEVASDEQKVIGGDILNSDMQVKESRKL
jgi:hypothetical protein